MWGHLDVGDTRIEERRPKRYKDGRSLGVADRPSLKERTQEDISLLSGIWYAGRNSQGRRHEDSYQKALIMPLSGGDF